MTMGKISVVGQTKNITRGLIIKLSELNKHYKLRYERWKLYKHSRLDDK